MYKMAACPGHMADVCCSPLHICKCGEDETITGKGELVPCRRCPKAFHEQCTPRSLLHLPRGNHKRRIWIAQFENGASQIHLVLLNKLSFMSISCYCSSRVYIQTCCNALCCYMQATLLQCTLLLHAGNVAAPCRVLHTLVSTCWSAH